MRPCVDLAIPEPAETAARTGNWRRLSVGVIRTMRYVLLSVCIALLLAATGCETSGQEENGAPPPIRVEPAPENHLYSISRVILEEVSVSHGSLDRSYPGAGRGSPCVIVKGRIRNMELDQSRVVLFAHGFNHAGQRVAETLDADGEISGQIVLQLEHGETGDFTLHLTECEETEVIRIFVFTYASNES